MNGERRLRLADSAELPGAGAGPCWLALLTGRPGTVLAFVWGVAEGLLFFVVPDVLFTLTQLFRPRRAFVQVGAAVAGAIVAGAVLYSWSERRPDGARAAVAAVPFVGVALIDATDVRFTQRGAATLFERPLGGVPYKVYAVLAPDHFPLGRFLLLGVPARLVRFVPSLALFAVLRLLLGRAPRTSRALAVHAAVWVVVYAYYWGLR